MLQTASVTATSSQARDRDIRDREIRSRENDVGIAYARRETVPVSLLMSQHLDLARPGSDAEALHLLRQAFPGASLTARVEAMARRAR